MSMNSEICRSQLSPILLELVMIGQSGTFTIVLVLQGHNVEGVPGMILLADDCILLHSLDFLVI